MSRSAPGQPLRAAAQGPPTLLSGLLACTVVGPALGGALAWLEWRSTWYVGTVLWVLLLPIAIHMGASIVRRRSPPSPSRALLLLTAGLATSLTLLDLPLAALGLFYQPLALDGSGLASIEPAALPPVVVVLETIPQHHERASGLGRVCETVPLTAGRALASCDGDLSSWEVQRPRWARVHRRRGAFWEARARPAVVRAVLSGTRPGVVFEAIDRGPARALTARWGAAGLTVLAGLLWLLVARPLGARRASS